MRAEGLIEENSYACSTSHGQVLISLVLRLIKRFIRTLRQPLKDLLLMLGHHLAQRGLGGLLQPAVSLRRLDVWSPCVVMRGNEDERVL
jgi:hypothetical protein